MSAFAGLGAAVGEPLPTRTKVLLGALGATIAFFAFSKTKKGEAVIQSSIDKGAALMDWFRPIVGASLVSKYGPRIDPITKKAGAHHNGVDFGVGVGTPIYAPFDGRIDASKFIDPATVYPSPNAVGTKKWLDANGNIPKNPPANYWTAASGQHVIMTDTSGKYTISFSHMSDRAVQMGDIVKRGQLLGHTGNTGYTTGPHAHVVLKVDKKEVDPMLVPQFAKMFA